MGKFKISKQSVKYWTVLNIGVLLVALSVYLFKAPNNFATGGVSGISIVICKYTLQHVAWLGQAEVQTTLNTLLIIIGFAFLGYKCMLKTAYCSIMYTLETQLLSLLYPIRTPLTDQVFLEFIISMLLAAGGSAIIFNCNASSGGTDIVALIIKKYTNLNVGKALLCSDFLIAMTTFFVFDVKTGFYSMLGLFTKTFIMDSVIESIGKCKYIQIITEKPKEIGDYILGRLNRGVTYLKAEGGYTKDGKTVILAVCNRSEALKIKLKLRTLDPAAFVIISDTNEILGKGFRSAI